MAGKIIHIFVCTNPHYSMTYRRSVPIFSQIIIGKVFRRLYAAFNMNKKVLIIDDEEDLGLLMKRFFFTRKIDVYVAHTIAEGMKLLEEQNPDFIFLDNNLPDGLGWGKTEYILDKYPQTQLNLISALDVPKTTTSSFRILEKPLLLEELTKMFG